MEHTFSNISMHPKSYQLPYGGKGKWYLNAGDGQQPKYFFQYIPAIINSVSSVSSVLSGDNLSNGHRWFWDYVASTTSTHYTTGNATTSPGGMVSLFSNSTNQGRRQIFYVRALSTSNKNGTSGKVVRLRTFSTTITADIEPIHTVEQGDTVTQDDMAQLADYIERLASFLAIGTYNIILPSIHNFIVPADWNDIITKANTLPHVSNLTIPSQDEVVSAEYYNSIANAVCKLT